MDEKTQVLETMKTVGRALNAGRIVELTNLSRNAVDKAMTELKSEDLIFSPKRCYWQAK